MKNENFKKLTTEDLIRKKKNIVIVTGILSGMLTVPLIINRYKQKIANDPQVFTFILSE
ncbi:hypothetical protein [Runella sp.]|uniref:hypothetical protein n=1 Tax=Runella sp. TaxID=1960881 RepID=UPI003D0B3FF6